MSGPTCRWSIEAASADRVRQPVTLAEKAAPTPAAPECLQSPAGPRHPLRYVYVTPIENHTLVVGILPTIDQVGRVLWDGEWDFFRRRRIAGRKAGDGDYRLGFYRIASDLKAGTIGTVWFGKDGDMWVADYNRPVKLGTYEMKIGGHFYSLNLGKRNTSPSEIRTKAGPR